jgi:quercetin dioxygenase-like cupin family protein
MIDPTILRRFEQPDEVRTFEKGRYEIVHVNGMSIGRASYEPGWRWSVHIGAAIGQRYCSSEHLGYVLSGTATAAFEDGRVFELRTGNVFYISPVPHDSWVIGESPYLSLHILGVSGYERYLHR